MNNELSKEKKLTRKERREIEREEHNRVVKDFLQQIIDELDALEPFGPSYVPAPVALSPELPPVFANPRPRKRAFFTWLTGIAAAFIICIFAVVPLLGGNNNGPGSNLGIPPAGASPSNNPQDNDNTVIPPVSEPDIKMELPAEPAPTDGSGGDTPGYIGMSDMRSISIYDVYAREDLLLFDTDFVWENLEDASAFKIISKGNAELNYLINYYIVTDKVAFIVRYRICFDDNYEFSGYLDYTRLSDFLSVSGKDVSYRIEKGKIVAGECWDIAYLTFNYGGYNYYLEVRNFEDITEVTEENLILLLGGLFVTD